MDDHEEAAAAARDPAALAEAPEDLHMAGAALHADQRGTTAAVGLHGPARAATASAQRLVERNAAAENAGVNVPDDTFTPSHRALVQVQRALREEARLTEPSRVLMGSWTGSLFADLHTSGRHAAAAEHLSEVCRGLQAHNLLGLANSTRQSAGLYVGLSMAVGAVRDRWYRIFDQHDARPFEDGYGLLLAMDEWLNAYVDPHAAEDMVAWLATFRGRAAPSHLCTSKWTRSSVWRIR